MDWMFKLAATAAVVAVVLVVAQRAGRTLAGIVAGLPVTSAPALIWIALDEGEEFATEAARGSLAVCVATAAFALAYAFAAGRWRPSLALAAGSVGALATAALAYRWVMDSAALLPLALLACTVALARMPTARDAVTAQGAAPAVGTTSGIAGAMSAGTSAFASMAGPVGVGMIAALPIVGGMVGWHEHRLHGTPAVRRFLRGYVVGLIGKSVFAGVFAALVIESGLAVAFAVALVAGVVCAWLTIDPRA